MPGRPEGERKRVTILFTDIAGSTAIAGRLDPEEWREVVSGAHRRVSEAVTRHGGTVAQLLGDGVLAFFGAPVAHEDDPVRAVRAALDIQATVAAYARELAGRVDDFAMRIGLHTGEVVVGEVGSEQHAEYLAVGDAVNLAARLQSAAEPGKVLLSESTARLVRGAFELTSLGEIAVKGKAAPVAVYRVQGAKAPAGDQRRGLTAHGLQSPLVGRTQEVAALNVCLGRLVNGQGGVVGITGEAGLGKSRLLAEVRAAHVGALWLEGHTLSFGQSISYWPFQEILRGYAGITDEDSEAEAWYKLERKVTVLFPDTTAEVLPYLGSLLAMNVPERYQSRVKYLDGEGLGKQIFRASWRFWESLAQRQPVVLVFEDLHWMDESSFRLVEHLLPLVRKVPLLMIGLSRPGPESMAARLREKLLAEYAEEYTDLRLAPLSPHDSAQLVRNLLAIENLTPQTRDLLVRKAEGNPFFLEEVIRMWIEAGVVERDAHTGQWRMTAQMETLTIPDTVRGVIMARVDRLDEQVKHVLRLASVIGRSFLYRVLRALDEADQELDRNLAELQAVELIREKQATPELEYIFRHALAQEATYGSILLQKRRELHAQVGAVIEALFADRLEEFYGLLAYHYAKAEQWEKAHEYLMKAADQSGQMAADGEALSLYQQAMAAYSRAFGDKWDPLQRAQLERKMGEALSRRGEHTQALECFERSTALLGHPLPVSRRDVRLGIVQAALRQAGHRLLPGLFLRKVGKPTPVVEEWWNSGFAAGWICAISDPERCLSMVLFAANYCEQNGLGYGTAAALAALGYICDLTGLFWLAEHYHRLAVTLAEQSQHPLAIGHAYMMLMNHPFYLGDLALALENGERSAKASREAGDLHAWAAVTLWTVRVLANKSDFSRALGQLREGVRIEQECGDGLAAAWLLIGEGFFEERMGYLDEAHAHLEQATELVETVPDYLILMDGLGELGRCYLREGQLSRALTVLERCPGYINEKRLKGQHMTSARNSLAEAYLVAAEQAGEKEKSGWLRKAGRACQVALKQGRIFRPGLPEAQRLQGRYEWLQGRHSQAKGWWQRGLRETEAMGLPYDEGMLYLEMGKRLGERAHLEKAAEIFAAIGAEYDLAKARGALERLKR